MILNKLTASYVLLISMLLSSSCGDSSGPQSGEWLGSIHIIMREPNVINPNGMVSVQQITVLKTSNSEEYVLLVPPDAEKIGIDVSGGAMSIDFGARYRIKGGLVTKSEELEVAAQFGFEQIIRATSIELVTSEAGEK